jgi:nucleoside-diphosphate-sugar epimerase
MGKRLKEEGYWVRIVDIKEYEYGNIYDYCNEFILGDLRDPKIVESSLRLDLDYEYSLLPKPFMLSAHFDEVYNFACQMGGAMYVFTGENDADIMHDSALINLNIANALKESKFTGKLFYSSSACVYPEFLQSDYTNEGLKESDAIPAAPDSCYGWEKLFSERLFLAYARNYGLDIRITRFHNIYGPEGTYKGGREKAPAAMCRKVIEYYADYIEVWGTGHQTRSFLYIDDCIDAVRLLMHSEFKDPINIGSEEMVTINQLAQMAIDLSGKDITIKNISGPTGVMGRNSNNELIEKELGWKPKFTLKEGMERTFNWIRSQYES